VQVDKCIVLAPSLNALLAPLKNWLTELGSTKAVTHIELINSDQGPVVVLRHTKKLETADLVRLESLAHKFNFTAWLQGGENSELADLSGSPVNPRLVYQLQAFGLELGFHPRDFIQVNPLVNEKMIAQAIDWLALKGNERVLDLFCGIGNFTLPLSRHCAEVFGLEAEDSMVERGRENALRANVTNAHFMAADLLNTSENRLHQLCGAIDVLLLDPPRDGAKEILSVLLQSKTSRLSSGKTSQLSSGKTSQLSTGKTSQLKPTRIVYVSCNPATLARDAKILAEAGYQLDSLGVMDMFPHTAHIESMALFVLGKK
jgi:23S rRNA (uracil1939-C5)-methyltransferase